ncbi:MAG: hypothetical protein VB092_07200 [Oscillospiraceae bacterium]|nr:hypothetical protein [Oscillospiraceae bacterium]
MKLLLSLFLFGASGYVLIELLWRGRSHVSMALAGGLSMLMLYGIQRLLPENPILLKSLLGAAGITAVEFFIGLYVNIRLRLGVWNYSDLPLNVRGQICLPFSAAWYGICVPIFLWLELALYN